MKKVSLIVLISLFLLPAIAEEEEVYLDIGATNIKYYDTGKLKFENPEIDAIGNEEKYLKPSDAFSSMWGMFKEDILHNEEQ